LIKVEKERDATQEHRHYATQEQSHTENRNTKEQGIKSQCHFKNPKQNKLQTQ